MRKVLSFVLVLSLVLGSFSAVFAASGSALTDVEGTKYEDAVNVLYDLGIVSGYEGTTEYRPEGIINRAEMAVIIVRAMGLEKSVTNDTSSFTDMSGYGWAEGYVAFAQGMGFVNGYGDGTFRPGNTVSYNEAATMLVGALGYTTNSLNGTYPANFVSQALSLGILKDIEASAEGANRGDVAIMVYQTLTCRIGTTNTDGNWVANTGNDTMLGRLYATEAYDGDFFVLTDSDADVSVMNTRPYIGAYVKAYWNDDEEIITISEVKSQFLTGKLNSDGDFKAGGVAYSVTNAIKATTAVYFNNGVQDNEGTLDHEAGKYTRNVEHPNVGKDDNNYYKVTLAAEVTGKTIRDIYSIMEWDSEGNHGRIEEGDLGDIKDGELFGYDFPEDYYGEIDYNAFALLGVNSLEDIKVDNVVYAYVNNSNVITRVEVGTEVVTGSISRIRDKSDLTISGTVYELSDIFNDLTDSDADDFETGDTVNLYLDYFGDWYDLETADGSVGNFAVVVALNDGGFNDPEIRLYLADGTTKTFTVDNDTTNTRDFFRASSTAEVTKYWNNASIDAPSGTPSVATGGGVIKSEQHANWIAKGDLIKYGVNNSGDITNIKKQVVETSAADDDAVIAAKYVVNKEITKRGVLQGAGTLSTNVAIFTVDVKNSEGKATELNDALDTITTSKLGVSSYDKVLDITKVTAKYVIDNNRVVAMIMDSRASTDDDIYGVVTNSDLVDNTAGGEIEFFINGSTKTYEADDQIVDEIDKYNGKFVRLEFDSAGAIKELVIVDDTDDVMLDYNIVSTGSVDFETNGRKITLTNGEKTGKDYSLDNPYYIYEWDTREKEWKKVGNLNSLPNRAEYSEVYIFDAIDDDGVGDTVVVIK